MAGTLRESGCPYRRKLLRVRPALFRGQPAFKQSARGGWEVYHPCLVKGKVIHCNFEPVERGHIRGLSSARSEVIFICNLNIIPSLMSSVSWTRRVGHHLCQHYDQTRAADSLPAAGPSDYTCSGCTALPAKIKPHKSSTIPEGGQKEPKAVIRLSSEAMIPCKKYIRSLGSYPIRHRVLISKDVVPSGESFSYTIYMWSPMVTGEAKWEASISGECTTHLWVSHRLHLTPTLQSERLREKVTKSFMYR